MFLALFCVSSFSPYNVVVHQHEYDPIFELLRFTLQFCHKFLNLFEDAPRSASWKYVPLEFRRLSIDSIQILEIAILQIPSTFFFQASTGWSLVLPRQSSESANTQVWAFVISKALSHSKLVDLRVNSL